jgi:predicted transcriptional regulator
MSVSLVLKLKPVFEKDNAPLDTERTAAMILKARQDLGIQQKALALEMGISDAYMHELESGSRKWKLKLFNRAKAALERLQPKT